MDKKDICFATFARNEKDRIPVWLKHYQQFVKNEDIYIIDQNTTDGSTDNLPCNIIYEPNIKIFDHEWLKQMITKNIILLLEKYHIVVLTEADELIITKNNIKLDVYLLEKYKNSNKNVCSRFIDIVQHDTENDYDINKKISKQRKYMFTWDWIATKHTIFTHCYNVVQNGFHDGDGEFDDNLVTIHIQLLNKRWYIDKIHKTINEKDKYGKGDNHTCWDVRYMIEKLDENLNNYYSNLVAVEDYLKNNIYI